MHKNRFQMSNTAVQLNDPLTKLVSDFANQISQCVNGFAKRCRQYVKQHYSQSQEISRFLVAKTTESNYCPSVTQRRDLGAGGAVVGAMGEGKKYVKQVRQKKKDDDVITKKPRSVYNLFVASQSIKIKQQNPHMRAPDIVRVAAQRYNNLSEEQKRPYIEKFEQAKRRFEEQQNQLLRFGGRKVRGRDYRLSS